jgi:hypothetical protein
VVKGSEFLATDPEVRDRFPALPDFLRNSEELLERKHSGSGLASEEY